MTDKVYRYIELVGTAQSSIEDAINNALTAAAKDNHKPCWFEVTETRGHVKDGKVDYFQVVVKVGLS